MQPLNRPTVSFSSGGGLGGHHDNGSSGAGGAGAASGGCSVLPSLTFPSAPGSPVASWGSGSPSSPTTQNDANRRRPRRTPKELWRDAIHKVKLQMAHMGRSPMVPVSRIEELKSHFMDPKTGKLMELDQDTFCTVMATALKGRDYSDDELAKWFADMDVDLSNSVSWEEFTSFMISAATTFGEENIRAKEFLPDNTVTPMTALLHKDAIKRLVTNRGCPYLVSGGFDGLVKLWSPTNGMHVYAINNNLYSAAHEAVPAGSAVPLSPIVDIAFNMRGSHCFVAAADKSVNIYDAKTFALNRKFVGTSGASLEASYWRPNNLGCSGVPDVNSRRYQAGGMATSFRTLENVDASVLLSMTESPSSLDIATPHDNEVLFFATHEGSMMAYPSLRSSVLPDIPQLAYYPNVHAQPISKMRYIPSLRALVAASWDTSISLTNPDTGQCIHRLLGHNQQSIDLGTDVLDTVDIGHRKSALDFAFSEAHRVLATVGADRAIMIWNPMFSMPVSSLRGHTAPLNSVAFDEIDNLLISMDCSGVVKTWDLRMNRCLQTFGGNGGKSDGGGSGGGGGGGGGGSSMDNKLDTPTAMIFSPEYHRIFSGGRSISSWTVRRAQTHFHPTHIGHCDGIISYAAFPATSSVVTGDANVLMRWCVKNGRRQSLWDINPPSVDGGDMLKTGGGGAGEGSSNGGGGMQQVSALACFDRDASQRRILAVTVDGFLIAYNPTNGQQLRRMDISAYLTDEPFRVAHLCNAHNSSKVIAVLSGREIVLISEDADEVTGLLPFAPFATIPAPPSTAVAATTATGHKEVAADRSIAGGAPIPAAVATFSAVAVYPAVGASTLPSLVVGTTEGHLQVFTPLHQEMTASVMHPTRARTARHSSHRAHRRPSDSSRMHTPHHVGGGGGGGASPVEDIVFLRSMDLFVTCVGDNSMFFWDLRNGLLKFQFTTMLQPQECILSIASGEDTMPFVSYDTVLAKRGGSSASLKGTLMMQQRSTGGDASATKKNKPIRSFAQLIAESLTVRSDGALALLGDADGAEGVGAAALADGVASKQGGPLAGPPPPNINAQPQVLQHRVLIGGCDWGYVYVWDISALPVSTAPTAAFVRCRIPLLSVFRAHNAPITRLSFFESERLICTMSTVDCYVKTFLLKGSLVGHMGQRVPFWYRDAKTFSADALSVPVEDEHVVPVQQPPPLSNSTSGGLPPRNNPAASAGAGGGGGVSPIVVPTSRPSTRQLDSPASSLFSSSFFTTAVMARQVSAKHAVESPRDIDAACFALVPEVVDPASFRNEFSPTAEASGGVAATGGPMWSSPFVSDPKQTASTTHHHALPVGLRRANGMADGAPPNLRPVLFAKKRLSIRATETEGIEEVRKRRPRHMASVVQRHHNHRGDGSATTTSPTNRSRRNSSDGGRGDGRMAVSPNNAAFTPSACGTPTPRDGCVALACSSTVRSPPALQPRGPPHHGGEPTSKPPRSPLPSIMANVRSSCDGAETSVASKSPPPAPSPSSTFLLTGLAMIDDDDVFSALPRDVAHRSHSVPLRTNNDRDGAEHSCSSERRCNEGGGSGTVPRVMKRSSCRYRSVSSLSAIPSSPTAAASPTNSGHRGRDYLVESDGSPRGAAAAAVAVAGGNSNALKSLASPLRQPATLDPSSLSPSPSFVRSGSPKVASGDRTAVMRRAVVDLHRIGTSRKTDTESRVDRVTRLIRDRELLKYRPVLIKTSLLDENEGMQREVAVMPSAWTSRASSLLKTYEFELEDIKKYWSPKKKEINKAKLLVWNDSGGGGGGGGGNHGDHNTSSSTVLRGGDQTNDSVAST